jgi:hypothetical protein
MTANRYIYFLAACALAFSIRPAFATEALNGHENAFSTENGSASNTLSSTESNISTIYGQASYNTQSNSGADTMQHNAYDSMASSESGLIFVGSGNPIPQGLPSGMPQGVAPPHNAGSWAVASDTWAKQHLAPDLSETPKPQVQALVKNYSWPTSHAKSK